jgi:hypothetical protein
MASVQPSLRDLCNPEFFPALKRRAIFEMSRRDKAKAGKSGRAGIPAGGGDLNGWSQNNSPVGFMIKVLVSGIIALQPPSSIDPMIRKFCCLPES